MIKILYVMVHLNYGGAEVGLLTTLKKINRQRFDCSVLSIEKKGRIGEEIEKAGFKVTYLNANARLYNIPLIFRIAKILKKEKPDILHTSLFYANFFGRVASLFIKPKVIITEERSMYTEKRFYHILIDKLLSGITDKIIACSKSVIDFTVKQENISREKFSLIYNAVDAERFNVSLEKSELRKKYGFSNEDFILGTVGSLIPKKGHRVLLEAASLLSKEVPNLKVLLVGDGKERKNLSQLASKLGISDKVLFLGARKDIPELMKIMDVFTLPSFQEGFPRTLVEAMYMGLPVIASNISGIQEVISDGKNGFIVPPGDPKMIAEKALVFRKNRDLCYNMGTNAKDRIISANMPTHYMSKLEGLYMQLYKGRR